MCCYLAFKSSRMSQRVSMKPTIRVTLCWFPFMCGSTSGWSCFHDSFVIFQTDRFSFSCQSQRFESSQRLHRTAASSIAFILLSFSCQSCTIMSLTLDPNCVIMVITVCLHTRGNAKVQFVLQESLHPSGRPGVLENVLRGELHQQRQYLALSTGLIPQK